MLSTRTQDTLLLYASSKIFLIVMHLADSVNPIMFSGLQILMKGKPESRAMLAASALLPALGAPSSRMETRPAPPAAACCTASRPSSRMSATPGLQWMMSRARNPGH